MPLEKPVAVVGTSFREVGFDALGALVLPPEAREARHALADALGAQELVYLATCNRVECYLAFEQRPDEAALRRQAAAFFSARGPAVGEDHLHCRTGRAVVEHLFATAASLDSLVVGESDIARQVRRSLALAREEGLAGPALERLFERARLCSRVVRARTGLTTRPVSVGSLAVSKIRQHFGAEGPGVSVLVGVGAMTHEIAKVLQDSPGERLFVNRTVASAEELAATYGGRALGLEAFLADPPGWVDLVFTATSASRPVLPADAFDAALAARALAGVERPLIVCDMGIPRDVEPAVAERDGVVLVALEDLELAARLNRARLDSEVDRARSIVIEEAARLVREERFRRLARRSAEGLLDGKLAHLPEADREALLRFATGLASRFARQPHDLDA